MNQEEKEIFLLKKRLENRESTISFLNEIIEAQSKSIDELKEKLGISEARIRELEECFDQIDSLYNKSCERALERLRMTKELEERINKLCDENRKLQSKLDILFNAFNAVSDQEHGNSEDNEKERHNKELSSIQWKKKRLEVFERYGKQCVECGSTDNIQVHHLVYRKGRHIWEYDVDELIPLCKECHQKIHNDKNHTLHEKYLP